MSSKKYTDDIKKEKQPKKYFLHAVPKKLEIMIFGVFIKIKQNHYFHIFLFLIWMKRKEYTRQISKKNK